MAGRPLPASYKAAQDVDQPQLKSSEHSTSGKLLRPSTVVKGKQLWQALLSHPSSVLTGTFQEEVDGLKVRRLLWNRQS